MAFLTSKEQYWRFKPFAELVVAFGEDDSDLKLEVVKGYIFPEGDDTLHLLAEISDDSSQNKGFKQDGKTKIQWAITRASQKKIFGKDATTPKLEKHIFDVFKAYAGKFVHGTIYVNFGLAFQKFEGGQASAVDMCFEHTLSEGGGEFEIPQAAASVGSGKGSYAPRETEAEKLKQKMAFVLEACGATGYFGDKPPTLGELAVALTSMGAEQRRFVSFALWLAINQTGNATYVNEVEAAIKMVRGE